MNEFENENLQELDIENEADSFDEEAKAPEEEKENSQSEFITYTVKGKEKKKSKVPRLIALSLVIGVVFGAGFGFSSSIARKFAMSKIQLERTDSALNKAEKSEKETSDIAAISEACMPSIVAITNKSVSDVMTFFGTYSQESTSTGSGIIIGKNDTELLIVTNYHVVQNAKELSVVFSPVEAKLELQSGQSDMKGGKDGKVDQSEIPSAIIKGYNSDKDLAVIAVNLEDISAEVLSEIRVATIGDSSSLKPGDRVVAIGNALGYGQSVTTGIISAVNRKITMESADRSTTVTNTFIQTDAAINSGNSGGALLDIEGNVIGINSVKIATTGVEGMGYAIPISDVETIIDELMVKKTRKLVDENKQGFLGITGTDVTAATSQAYGIPTGVFINGVEEGLGAQKAGLKKGDVIVEFDGYSITSISQLQDRLRYYEAGEKIEVTVKVADTGKYKTKKVKVTLSNRPKEAQ